ncbi:MAG: 5-(carboxyamino)imidazole ribonucleotide mutase [Candidatus Omnitrophota bacterium]
MKPTVAVLMGSDSDEEVMKECSRTLEEFEVGYEWRILSAHRSPEMLRDYVTEAESRGVQVFIAAAGGAAHLAGAVAALTSRPVLGVPIASTSLNGLDALLSTVQMPGGVPVSTFAVGPAGAKNAALTAVQILALGEPEFYKKLKTYKDKLGHSVREKDAKLQTKLQKGK